MSATDSARISDGNPRCEFLGRGKDGASIPGEMPELGIPLTGSQTGGRGGSRDLSQRERRRVLRESDRRSSAIFDKPNLTVERMLGYSTARSRVRGTFAISRTLATSTVICVCFRSR